MSEESESLKEFTANDRHELQTPLLFITLNLDADYKDYQIKESEISETEEATVYEFLLKSEKE